MIAPLAAGRNCYESSDIGDPGVVAYRSLAGLAVQYGLGLLSKRRLRSGARDCAGFGVDGSVVNLTPDSESRSRREIK